MSLFATALSVSSWLPKCTVCNGGTQMNTIVLLRHGESVWNRENRFTGWTDVDLSSKGIEEAQNAAVLLSHKGFRFDLVFTSVLKRAIRTAWIVMDRMDLMWLPLTCDWRLNERHYGALQGLNKAATAAKYGEEQVKLWRRSYDIRPPALDSTDPRYPGGDPKYQSLKEQQLPLTESLKDTVARVLPFWKEVIAPNIYAAKRVLIVAHGNSLRALVKHLDRLSDDEVVNLEIPTGVPFVQELDSELRSYRSYYLDDLAIGNAS